MQHLQHKGASWRENTTSLTKIYILYRRPYAFKECYVLKGSIFLNTANCTPGNKHILLIIIACFSKDYLILLKQVASFESAVHIFLEYTGMFFQAYNNFEMFTIGLKGDWNFCDKHFQFLKWIVDLWLKWSFFIRKLHFFKEIKPWQNPSKKHISSKNSIAKTVRIQKMTKTQIGKSMNIDNSNILRKHK